MQIMWILHKTRGIITYCTYLTCSAMGSLAQQVETRRVRTIWGTGGSWGVMLLGGGGGAGCSTRGIGGGGGRHSTARPYDLKWGVPTGGEHVCVLHSARLQSNSVWVGGGGLKRRGYIPHAVLACRLGSPRRGKR